MNVELYHELVEAEVFRLRREVQMLQLELKIGNQKPAHPFPTCEANKKAGAVANMLGVTDKDFNEAEELALETFKAPRNLTSDPIGWDGDGREPA